MPVPTSTSPRSTNTLLITSLPSPFFHSLILAPLRALVVSHTVSATDDAIHTWAPIRVLSRVVVVFWQEEDAERVRDALDGLVLGDPIRGPSTALQIYRGNPTSLTPPSPSDSHRHLRPPTLQKNFLISPPGSPPAGWEQIVEDSPNTKTLADDLSHALEKLQIEQEWSNMDGQGRGGTKEATIQLMRPDSDEEGLSVFVEDCDFDEDGQDAPEVVEMVRGGISTVKATVESMGLGYNGPNVNPLPNSIPKTMMPTSRPPL